MEGRILDDVARVVPGGGPDRRPGQPRRAAPGAAGSGGGRGRAAGRRRRPGTRASRRPASPRRRPPSTTGRSTGASARCSLDPPGEPADRAGAGPAAGRRRRARGVARPRRPGRARPAAGADRAPASPRWSTPRSPASASPGRRRRGAATDLVAMAAGGYLVLTGDEDRPPVRISLDQAFHHAAADAAGAVLIALRERHRSGRGPAHRRRRPGVAGRGDAELRARRALRRAAHQRVSGGTKLPPFTLRLIHPCLDGYVTTTFLFGPSIGPVHASG